MNLSWSCLEFRMLQINQCWWNLDNNEIALYNKCPFAGSRPTRVPSATSMRCSERNLWFLSCTRLRSKLLTEGRRGELVFFECLGVIFLGDFAAKRPRCICILYITQDKQEKKSSELFLNKFWESRWILTYHLIWLSYLLLWRPILRTRKDPEFLLMP